MGDGCGSGTVLDPYSSFYCASLSLYYFMFTALLSSILLQPGELAKHAVSDGTCHQSRHRCDFSFEPGRE